MFKPFVYNVFFSQLLLTISIYNPYPYLSRLRRQPQNEDNLKNEVELKNEDDLKNEDALKNEGDLKKDDDLKTEVV